MFHPGQLQHISYVPILRVVQAVGTYCNWQVLGAKQHDTV